MNLVGGQDELVFDGGSLVMDAAGAVVTRAPQFTEVLFVTDLAVPARPGFDEGPGGVEAPRVRVSPPAPPAPVVVAPVAPSLSAEREVYEALVLGTRDYVTKNGFGDVVVGLSGGIDSSLVATIAVDALGPERVHGVLMPSRYSSDHSITDAEALAANLGIDHRTIAIEPAHRAFTDMLAPSFAGRPADLTEENLQSRLRGVTLMALSNKLGWLVLTTGNKSESAVGYSTLYGDTAGGFAVIKDVLKLLVYRLCRDRNARAGRELIPETILVKPPSAELRPDQRDDQSLPPYEVLDPIIDAYVTEDRTAVRAGAGRLRRGHCAARGGPHRPGRVQAPPDTTGGSADHQGLRQGPAPAHHQRLPRLTAAHHVSTPGVPPEPLPAAPRGGRPGAGASR